jgi:hypothetical protein
MRQTALATVLGAIGVFASTTAGVADQCDAILRSGTWDFSSTSSSSYQTSSFLNWMCSQSFQSFAEMKDTAVKIGIPVNGIPLEIGGANAESSWSEYYRATCEVHAGQFKNTSNFANYVRSASEVIANAWSSCVNRPGLYARLTYVDRPVDFTVTLSFKGVKGTDQAKIGPVVYSPRDGVMCSPGKPVENGLTLDSDNDFTFLCSRPQEQAVTLVFNADQRVYPSTLSARVVKSTDPAEYLEISNEVVTGSATFVSKKIIVKAGATIRIIPQNTRPTLTFNAGKLIFEGPFTITGTGTKGGSGAAGRDCPASVPVCQWRSGPEEDKDRCNDTWRMAGGGADDQGQPGGAGGQGGPGPLVTFLYRELEGATAFAKCDLPGGPGGDGGPGGQGRLLINCATGETKRGGDHPTPTGPAGPQGPDGSCEFHQM